MASRLITLPNGQIYLETGKNSVSVQGQIFQATAIPALVEFTLKKDGSGDYSTFGAFLSGEARDLVTLNQTLRLNIYKEGWDVATPNTETYLEIGNNFTTDAAHRVELVVVEADRHNFTEGTGFVHKLSGNYGYVVRSEHALLVGLELKESDTYDLFYEGTNVELEGCLSYRHSGTGSKNVSDANNCIFYEYPNEDVTSSAPIFGGTATNCVIILTSNNAAYHDIGPHTSVTTNCLVYKDFTKIIYNAYYTCTGDYNGINQSGEGIPGANSVENLTKADFVDFDNNDFRIKSNSAFATNGSGGTFMGATVYTAEVIPQIFHKLPKNYHPDFSIPGKKPVGAVGIDWSNPLAKGISCELGIYDNQLIDLTGNAYVVPSADYIKKPGYISNNSGGGGISGTLWNAIPTAVFNSLTMCVRMDSTGMTSYGSPAGSASDSFFQDANSTTIFSCKIHADGWNQYHSFRFEGLLSSLTTGLHTYVLRWSSTENSGYAHLFVDGVNVGTSTTAYTGAYNRTFATARADQSLLSNSTTDTKLFRLRYYPGRYLTDADIKQDHIDPYQVLKPAIDYGYFAPVLEAVGGGTPVSNTISPSWSSLQNITSNMSAQWSMIQTVATNTQVAWTAIQSVLANSNISWDALKAVTTNSPIAWDLIERVGKSVSPAWDLLAAISNVSNNTNIGWSSIEKVLTSKNISWESLEGILANTDVSWDSVERVLTNADISWDAIEKVLASKDINWNSVEKVISSRNVSWDSLHQISNNTSLAWDSLQQVNQSVSAAWDLISSLMSVSNNTGVSWDSLATITNNSQIKWELLETVGSNKSVSWGISAAVGTSTNLSWDSLERVGSNTQVSWDLVSSIYKQLQASWDLMEAVGVSSDISWDLANAVATQTQVAWDIAGGVTNNVSVSWDSVAVATNGIQLKWSLLSDNVNYPLNLITITHEDRIIKVIRS